MADSVTHEQTLGPPPSSNSELDSKLNRLQSEGLGFARLPPSEKSLLLGQIRGRFWELSPRMVELGCLAKGIDPQSQLSGEEWLAGPVVALRGLRLFEESLSDIARLGSPRIEAADVRELRNGLSGVSVFPRGFYDRWELPNSQCEVWLKDRVSAGRSIETHASFYRARPTEGRVTLVLGAGNVGSISVLDVLHHAFVRGSVCLLKMSPVNAYLGPLYEHAFEPLVARGFLAFAYGGAEIGEYLVEHAAIDAIHVTGSVDTHDRIVWGPPGPEREQRKQTGRPRLTKPVTSELGNISPVLIVPGNYSDRELTAIAKSIAGMVVQNASFNCNAAKMLVSARGWPQRDALLARLAGIFQKTPARRAYYPGSVERYRMLLASVEDASVDRWGTDADGALPWTLVSGLNPNSESPLLRVEPFCSLFSETQVGSPDPVEYLQSATEFANARLWGTLNAMLIVSPRHQRDPRLVRAKDDAIAELRYGTIGVNLWPAVAYGLVSAPWGGHPSNTLGDVQSGIGWGHDALMLENAEKVVLQGPLGGLSQFLWVPGQRHLGDLGRAVAHLEWKPDPTRILQMGWAALRA